MAHENIEATAGNFCLGPQVGTYCYVDFSDINNVVLRIKNSSGDLLRSYFFLPYGIFYTDPNFYPYNFIIDLKYVGPKNLSYFYTGAIFYTMERVQIGTYQVSNNDEVEYSDRCIIRKWVLDNDAFTLSLANTWYKNSDSNYYFDSFSFAVQQYSLFFDSSETTGTGEITLNDTSLVSVGDTLMLGPSTDIDNLGKLEYVYAYSIIGNTVEIRSFDGTISTKYEYVKDDNVTLIGDIFLFSNPRPIIGISSGNPANFGTGADGDVIISVQNTVINKYTYVTDSTIPSGIKHIAVDDASNFNVGQEILIYQVQNYSDSSPGIFEFNYINNIVGNILVLNFEISREFKSGIFDSLQAEITQIVSVPNYKDLHIISGGSITAKNWDGYSGGLVVYRASGKTYFEEYNLGIDVSGKGFRGGGDNGGGDGAPGDPGEGYKGLGWVNNSTISNCLPNANGGGGGYGPSGYGGTSGGGGGSRFSGENATDSYEPPALAEGGNSVGDLKPNTLFLGGGGGGGGDDDNQTPGVCKGGDGGGIVIIKSKYIYDLNIKAFGENGTNSGGSAGGAGGGGGGGVIFVEALSYTQKNVNVDGGKGGTHPYDAAGNGGLGYNLITAGTTNNILQGFEGQGSVYRLDQLNYCAVIDVNENAKYTGIKASVWNNATGGLSFVKVNNYMTVDIDDNYENIKSQIIKTLTSDFEILQVYAVDSYGIDIYFLQKRVAKTDDTGVEIIVKWQTYNYVKETIIPYNYSTNIIIDRVVQKQYLQTDVHVIVRDQFGNGVLGADVFYSYLGDPGALLLPSGGYLVTDNNGYCYFTFITGSVYTGTNFFNAKSSKGNTMHGSEFTNCYSMAYCYSNYKATVFLTTIEPQLKGEIQALQVDFKKENIYISGFSKFIFGIGQYQGKFIDLEDIRWGLIFQYIYNALILQVLFPTQIAESYSAKLPHAEVFLEQLFMKGSLFLTSVEPPNTLQLISQLSSSRHIDGLNKDHSLVNQYVFIQDAIPAFWSEKITVNTYIWIRLRPFAYSLDPTTLIFKIREVNEPTGYDSGFIDVTSLGEITLYDAGGGMFGVDFNYQPSKFFINESIVYISIFIKDTAPIPNILTFD